MYEVLGLIPSTAKTLAGGVAQNEHHFFFFLVGWGLNSALCTCKAGALPFFLFFFCGSGV
jgi:hypothetical protein